MTIPHLRIAVIGGRGFGKTSLATSLMNVVGNSNGTVVVKGTTQAILSLKNAQLAQGSMASTDWKEIQQFRFVVRSAEKERWNIALKDYPGEFFEKYAELQHKLSESKRPSENGRAGTGMPEGDAAEATTIKRRAMDSFTAREARKLAKSLLRNDALVVLLPWDITGNLASELSVFKQKVFEFLEKCGAALNGIPVCLAVNKWDLTPDPEASLETLLADPEKPFRGFYEDLKQLLGENLFPMAVSAFGQRGAGDQAGGSPFNVLEMLINLARRTDQGKLRNLKALWNEGSWLGKMAAVPLKSAWTLLRGSSSDEQAGQIKQFLADGCRKFGKTVLAFLSLAGIATLLVYAFFSGRNAWQTLGGIKGNAATITRGDLSHRDAIEKTRGDYEQVPWVWRFLLGRSTGRDISRLEESFNNSVRTDWDLAVKGTDLRDGGFEMHPTNRLARSMARREATTNAIQWLLPGANHAAIRQEMAQFVEAETERQAELERFRESDTECYVRLNAEAEPGEKALVLNELLRKYEGDSLARSERIKQLRDDLYGNQAAAAEELSGALGKLEELLAGDDWESVADRCKEMVKTIDTMKPRFVGTNFDGFAELRKDLLDELFAATTNEIALIGERETAVERTHAANKTIVICDAVADVWDAGDPRKVDLDYRRKDAQEKKESLTRYVKWEKDFKTAVTAETAKDVLIGQLATFLEQHPKSEYPDYSKRWDELDAKRKELRAQAEEEIEEKYSRLSAEAPPATNYLRRAEWHQEKADSLHKWTELDPEGSEGRDKKLEEEQAELAESDKYKTWEIIRGEIDHIEEQASSDSPETTIAMLVAFDKLYTNSTCWHPDADIQSSYLKRGRLLITSENLLGSKRKEELDTLGDGQGLTGRDRIDWLQERLEIIKCYEGKFYPGSVAAQDNTRQLREAEKSLSVEQSLLEFDAAYKKIDQTSSDSISEFLKNYPEDTYVSLRGDITSIYKGLHDRLTFLRRQSEWDSLKVEAVTLLGKAPKNTAEWENLRADLGKIKEKISEFCAYSELKSEAEDCLGKIRGKMAEYEKQLGEDSFKALENCWQSYEQDPSPGNFAIMNAKLNSFDMAKAPEHQGDINKWKNRLRDDAKQIDTIRAKLARFTTTPGQATFNTLKAEYERLKNTENWSTNPNKYPFWSGFAELARRGSDTSEPLHWDRIHFNLEKPIDKEIWVKAMTGNPPKMKKVFKAERIGAGDSRLPCRRDCLCAEISVGHWLWPYKTHQMDRYKVFALGVRTGKALYPSDRGIRIKELGGTIGIIIDQLPQVVLGEQDYRYKEKP